MNQERILALQSGDAKRDISSSYARANSASCENDDVNELHHILLAARDVLVLLHHQRNGLDEAMANSYSQSLVDSAVRIHDMIKRGV